MNPKASDRFLYACLLLMNLAGEAFAQEVRVLIDQRSYRCVAEESEALAPKYRPRGLDPDATVQDASGQGISGQDAAGRDAFLFDSSVDLDCARRIAPLSKPLEASKMMQALEACRRGKPQAQDCQALHSSPDAACLEWVETQISATAFKVAATELIKACGVISYRCARSGALPR